MKHNITKQYFGDKFENKFSGQFFVPFVPSVWNEFLNGN